MNGNLDIPFIEKNKKLIFFIIVVCVMIKMTMLNNMTPPLADDYQILYNQNPLVSLSRFWNELVLGSNFVRFTVHILNFLFFLLPNYFYSVIRAAFYVCLTLIIYKMSNTKNKYNIFMYLLIVLSILLFTRNFGEVMFWRAGFGYLIAMVVLLLYLLPFHLYIVNGKLFKHDNIAIFGMFMFGLFAGMTMEINSGASVLVVIMIFTYCYVYKQKIKKWMISGFIGSIIGCLLFILPMALNNHDYRTEWVPVSNVSYIRNILNGIGVVTSDFIATSLAPLVIIFIVLIVTQVLTSEDRKRTIISIMYATTSVLCAYAIALSPYVVLTRTMFPSTIFMIIACVHCAIGISLNDTKTKIIRISAFLVLAFIFTTTLITGAESIFMTKVAWDSRMRYIEQQKAIGNLNLIVEELPPAKNGIDARYSLSDLSDNPKYWANMRFAELYGLESIIAIPRD
ncbi:MAG: DUF6056 family protein [Oscillospiraceae bacterium]|nr:DUF6056 family protein [Oscillospiraceae bacterium]